MRCLQESTRRISQLKRLLIFTFALLTFFGLSQGQTPRTAEDYNTRGLERQNNGDLEGAIEDYSKAISLKAKPINNVR